MPGLVTLRVDASAIVLEFKIDSKPPLTVTFPLPSAEAELAVSVPASTVVPPVYELPPDKIVVPPVPLRRMLPSPEIAPDHVWVPVVLVDSSTVLRVPPPLL